MKQIREISLCVDCRDAHHFPNEATFEPHLDDNPLSLIDVGYSITDNDVRHDFGKDPCGGCGSLLAGYRFDFTLWKDM